MVAKQLISDRVNIEVHAPFETKAHKPLSASFSCFQEKYENYVLAQVINYTLYIKCWKILVVF